MSGWEPKKEMVGLTLDEQMSNLHSLSMRKTRTLGVSSERTLGILQNILQKLLQNGFKFLTSSGLLNCATPKATIQKETTLYE